jgi:hypothetical protein
MSEPPYDVAAAAELLDLTPAGVQYFARQGRLARLWPGRNLFSRAAIEAVRPTIQRRAHRRPERPPLRATCIQCGAPMAPARGKTCCSRACSTARRQTVGEVGGLTRWGHPTLPDPGAEGEPARS